MSLFGLKEKKEIEQLKAMLPKEAGQILDYQSELEKVRKETAAARTALVELKRQCEDKQDELLNLKKNIVETNDAILFQEFGLYEPHFSFTNSEKYKSALKNIRDTEKQVVKDGAAVLGAQDWTVNGSTAQGKKLVKDTQKLLLRAFNAECDDVIEHVKYHNVDASEKRIEKSAEAISKLGKVMNISISQRYYSLKLQELYLAFEYQQKKEEEKEAQREVRARIREEKKLAEEIESERKKLEKEQNHYQNELSRLSAQIEKAEGDHKQDLVDRYNELSDHLDEINEEFKAVDYREANQKAGYVYVISNIGSFGEEVYKIGMTRRLDPQDRIDELGSASVPFTFDVHAMIFSDNAPALEAALHSAFADKKVNLINSRKEFFKVSLDEIKKVVYENFDGTVEFTELPAAEQYRETLKMREQMQVEPSEASTGTRHSSLAKNSEDISFDW